MRCKTFIFLVTLVFSTSLHAETRYASSSLTLDAARQLLLEKNHELLAGRRAVEGLQADTVAAGQRPNPTLSVNTAALRLEGRNGDVLKAERMDIVAGSARYRLAGSSQWIGVEAGTGFEVEGDSSFDIEVDSLSEYLCSYM